MEEVFYVPIVEHARQLESLHHLNIEGLGAGDVIPMIGRFRPGFAGVKKTQENSTMLQRARKPVHHGLHQGFGKVIGDIPGENGVERALVEYERIFEELLW
jgi:hypothetical protein